MFFSFSRFLRVSILMGLLLVVAAGCGPKGESVGDDQNNGTVDLQVGETLSVSLDSNPTTGYTWEIKEIDSSILQQQGEAEYKQAAGTKGLVGAGGRQTFRFKAVGTGQTALILIYHRTWETDVDPAQTYTLTVSVR